MGVSIYRPQLNGGYNQRKVIDLLVRQGQKICNLAARTHQTKRQTGNQENAYGYGVYLDGALKSYGVARVNPATGPIKVKGNEYWGRKEIYKFLRSYHPELAGYTLIVANAVFYSAIHEEGTTKRIYQIVTQTYSTLVNETSKLIESLNLKNAKGMTFWRWTRYPSDYIGI